MPTRVLYDSGASVSFVSHEFSKNVTTPINKLPFHLEVEIVDDKVVVVSNMFHNVEIEIDDSTFKIDLIPIMLGVFDIVISMDWLEKYDASILCSQKLVRVVNPQGREIIIYGDKRKGDFKLCSVMKARRFLSRVCHTFMAHVIDTSFEKKGVEDVPFVNEFIDVFPEDLPGIPPERQVEFQIDPVSGATLIAKTPYRLALSEIKESRGYYRRFIQDFSNIASSLTKLTRKNTPFEWGTEQDEAFTTLQKKLCEAPILVIPEGIEDMVVYSDASYSGLKIIDHDFGACIYGDFVSVNTYDILTNNEFPIFDIWEKIFMKDGAWVGLILVNRGYGDATNDFHDVWNVCDRECAFH
ncbi:putative reverse transcriptase domain-containing protein [Tanacetum coccineum]|uniref:Reverse transcriptase domain-containing protein n=1 Tax=Tanacetum coccineum TaxID=301880 RepID=A0ABQ5BZV3_9ASTR